MSHATPTDLIPEPCLIAGTPMRPYSLGHHLLMRRLCLPFAGNPAADAGPGDIMMGVAICGAPYRFTLDAMLSGDWADVFKRWLKRTKGSWWNRRRVDWNESERLFRAYLMDGYKLPPLMKQPPGQNCIEFTSLWEELILVRLTQAGFNPEYVMDGYLPAMRYHYFTALEIRIAETVTKSTDFKKVFYTRELHEQLHPEINQ